MFQKRMIWPIYAVILWSWPMSSGSSGEAAPLEHKEAGGSVNARVLAVKANLDLVMLDVGTNDKVHIGMFFTVYRGNKYIGKVRVTSVWPDMCAARVIHELTRGKIAEGDQVSTSTSFPPQPKQPGAAPKAPRKPAVKKTEPAGAKDVF